MKYAIYGAGSLGTVLGAYISKAGTDIELVSRNREHVSALNENGAKVIGGIELYVPVKAVTPEEMDGLYDVIFLLTKQQQNLEAKDVLLKHLAKDGLLVTLQNGIPEPSLEEIFGKERVMGCTVEWGATLVSPGVCRFTSDPSPEKLSFQTGKPEAVPMEKFKTAVSLLRLMGPVHVSGNFIGVRWSKLLINATFAGIGTVMGGSFGDAAADRDAKKIASACIKECIDVSRAAGVTLTDVQGISISKLFYYSSPLKKRFVEFLLPFAMRKNGSIEPSMLQDLKKGKKCEVDFINGEVCRWGKKYGVPTPINDTIIETIKKEELGELPISKSNLDLFS
ncbi:MAG: ketopantoate reductase family protein [Firmicutes bacterium]|nr:ketopantoate reductase family protein [Bacillota bacterium]